MIGAGAELVASCVGRLGIGGVGHRDDEKRSKNKNRLPLVYLPLSKSTEASLASSPKIRLMATAEICSAMFLSTGSVLTATVQILPTFQEALTASQANTGCAWPHALKSSVRFVRAASPVPRGDGHPVRTRRRTGAPHHPSPINGALPDGAVEPHPTRPGFEIRDALSIQSA